MMQVLVDQEKELATLESDTEGFMSADMVKINQRAAQLKLAYVITR
jgi:hypothetical protein